MYRIPPGVSLELNPTCGFERLHAILGGAALLPDESKPRFDEPLAPFVDFGEFPDEKWRMAGYGDSVAVKYTIGESAVSIINTRDAELDPTSSPTMSLSQIADRIALESRRLDFRADKIDVDGLSATERESLLIENLESMAERINLRQHMAPVKKREIRNQTAYQLTAIFTNEDDESNLDHFRKAYLADKGVAIRTRDADGVLGIEDKFALGLTYHNLLIAVATGRVDDDGNLFIRQMQGVTSIQSQEEGMEYGQVSAQWFRNGFWWRDMLVGCWEEIAEKVGCPAIIIQSHKNSIWPYVREHGWKAYDEVASRMHYDRLPNNDWVNKLSSNRGEGRVAA